MSIQSYKQRLHSCKTSILRATLPNQQKSDLDDSNEKKLDIKISLSSVDCKSFTLLLFSEQRRKIQMRNLIANLSLKFHYMKNKIELKKAKIEDIS